jgi:NAD(P)-dependent dehydrogenase (short-subunit alcohol dehydrogenase family)
MTDSPTAFAGKIALITGGSSGIGRATALAFARNGAQVVIASRRADRGEATLRDLRALNDGHEFVQCDVSVAADVSRLIASVVERFGRLDCAVNNAATIDAGLFKRTADVTEEEYDRHLAVNLKSVWLCMKHEILQMERQGAGVIVNTSSVNGLGGAPHSAVYAAAKAGILGFTKSAALEYAKSGIRINALVAGAFRTPMLESVFARVSPDDPVAVEGRYASLVPLGRIGDPEEAAHAILWLCSADASYVTGHSMIVDGGMTAAFR